jgi:hypothetical protein
MQTRGEGRSVSVPPAWHPPRFWTRLEPDAVAAAEDAEDREALRIVDEVIPSSDAEEEREEEERRSKAAVASAKRAPTTEPLHQVIHFLGEVCRGDRWWNARPPYLRSRRDYERALCMHPNEAERVKATPVSPREEGRLSTELRQWLRALADPSPGGQDFRLSLSVLREKLRDGTFASLEGDGSVALELWHDEFDGLASAAWREDEEGKGGGGGRGFSLAPTKRPRLEPGFDRLNGDLMMWLAKAERRRHAASLRRLPHPRGLLLWALQVLPRGPASRLDQLCRAATRFTDVLSNCGGSSKKKRPDREAAKIS